MNLVRKQSWVVITQFCGDKNIHNRFDFLTVITLLSVITLPPRKSSKIKVWKLRYFVPKISYPFDICFFQKVYRTNFSITIFLICSHSELYTNYYVLSHSLILYVVCITTFQDCSKKLGSSYSFCLPLSLFYNSL